MRRVKCFALPVILVFAAIYVFMFTACKAENAGNKLIGKWTLSSDFSSVGMRIPSEIEFFSDGSVQSDWGGKYSVDGEKLNVYYTAMDSYSYTFKIEENVLVLKSDIGQDNSDGTEYLYLRSGEIQSNDVEPNNETDANTQTQEAKLSDECDYLLAEGTSTTGDVYELVMNESDTYDAKQSIGLIKNNEWLINMTSDSPIIDEATGSVYYFNKFKERYEYYLNTHKKYPTTYKLVTNNCFSLFDYCLWNFESGKIYHLNNGEEMILDDQVIDTNRVIITTDHVAEFDCKVLNTDDMTVVKSIDRFISHNQAKPFSEGLFYAYAGDVNEKKMGFYDENCNLIIDLSKYGVDEGGIFLDGKAVITARNSTGKSFEITIDKKGNVISEKAID